MLLQPGCKVAGRNLVEGVEHNLVEGVVRSLQEEVVHILADWEGVGGVLQLAEVVHALVQSLRVAVQHAAWLIFSGTQTRSKCSQQKPREL